MTTALRTREFGVRCALGRWVRVDRVDDSARTSVPVLAGLAAGGLAAAAAVNGLKSSLYGFTVYDARPWAVALLAILIASSMGALLPALRASRVNPVEALRAE